MAEYKMIAVTYTERRLAYFQEQLAHHNRRLDYAIKHSDEYKCAEVGDEVAFYQDVVQFLEQLKSFNDSTFVPPREQEDLQWLNTST